MKKIIFILITLAMIFVVFSCDEPKGTENTESTQTGTTGGNNTNTDTDNTTTDNNTNADNKDYITQNPYEELEKTLTVKVNSIDEVEITEGEWEYYWEENLFHSAADDCSRISRSADIIEVKNDGSIEYYTKGESCTYICNSIESYEEMKEFVYERMMPPDEDETIVFDDENLTIYFFYAGYKGNSTYDDFIIYRIEKFFNEDTSEETDEYLDIDTYSVTTNSEKDAYFFYSEEKKIDKIDSAVSGGCIIKYIFKKIK